MRSGRGGGEVADMQGSARAERLGLVAQLPDQLVEEQVLTRCHHECELRQRLR